MAWFIYFAMLIIWDLSLLRVQEKKQFKEKILEFSHFGYFFEDLVEKVHITLVVNMYELMYNHILDKKIVSFLGLRPI